MEGGAGWSATGPENQAVVKHEGSTPSPSATERELAGVPAPVANRSARVSAWESGSPLSSIMRRVPGDSLAF